MHNKIFKSNLDWQKIIQDVYIEKYNYHNNLNEIHKLLDTTMIEQKHKDFYYNIPIFGINDRKSIFVKDFYNYYDNNLIIKKAYNKFIETHLKPLFNNEKLVVQKTPNIRFHLPFNSNIGRLETDPNENIIGLHCDSEFGHPSGELNIIISITDMYDTNSLYYEINPDSKKCYDNYENLQLKKNNVWIGNLNKCKHFNKINLTNKTRISIDFRVIPYSKYLECDNQSLTDNMKFKIGDYYILI